MWAKAFLSEAKALGAVQIILLLLLSVYSVFYLCLLLGHLLEQGFLPICPVWHICITFMSTNKFDLIDLIWLSWLHTSFLLQLNTQYSIVLYCICPTSAVNVFPYQRTYDKQCTLLKRTMTSGQHNEGGKNCRNALWRLSRNICTQFFKTSWYVESYWNLPFKEWQFWGTYTCYVNLMKLMSCNIFVCRYCRLVDWCLMALSAQKGYIISVVC